MIARGLSSMPDDFDTLQRLISRDDGRAAREHLQAGYPVYVSGENEFPGKVIRINPNGTRDLVRFDKTGEIVDRNHV